MKEKRLTLGELSQGVKFAVDEIHKLTLLGNRRIRLAGMFFDTDKCFLLPVAIPGMKRVVETHAEKPAAKLLIIGHTDTSGKDDYNAKLSLERAQAVADYLHEKVDAWEKHFQDPSPAKRWGAREIQLMLKRIQVDGFPFLLGEADGKDGPATQAAVRSYQKARRLTVDGIAGPQTRKAMIKDYMGLDGTTLPADAKVTLHGCGEAFPAAEVEDGAKSPQDRRVEILFFDGEIKPPPPGEISKKGSKEYPQWVGGITETVELIFADLTEGFDFDLPKQKELVFEPEPLLAGGGNAEPILVAANDDRVVASIIAEAREQDENRGKDNTVSGGKGNFIPFKLVDKAERPDIKFDHGFLDDGNGNLDTSKKRDPEFSDVLAYMKWDAKVSAAEILRPDLVDATRAYRNFLSGFGFPMVFDYEKYVREDRAGKKMVESSIEDATAAALEFSDNTGKTDFTMQTAGIAIGPKNSRFPYPGTENWQKAIGAHVVWIEAKVKVKVEDKKRLFEILLILRAEDRYNFNPKNADIATGIPDSDNGLFEITGLGKEFDTSAQLKRKVTFQAGLDPVPDLRKEPEGKNVSTPR